MLSRFILRFYPTLIEWCLWILPITAFLYFGGSNRYLFNWGFGIFGFISTFMVCAITAGWVLVLIEIRDSLKK